MAPTDSREIIFAGAGILWGATTFFRALSIWRAEPKRSSSKKSPVPSNLIAGFVLIIGCSAYLAWSLLDGHR